MIRFSAIQRALGDLDATVVVTNAEVRIEATQSAATRNVVTQDARGDFPNGEVPVVVLSVVQDVARGVVLQSSATRFAAARCVQVAVFQCVADLDAMAVLPNAAVLQSAAEKVLPDGAQVGVQVDRLAPAAVHAVQRAAEVAVAQAPAVFQFSVPPPVLTWLRVALAVALAYCPRRECCVVRVHSRRHYAGCHLPFDSDVRSDRDVHRAVDPLTRVVQDDLLRPLAAFRFVEFRPCWPAVKNRVSVLAHGRYVCVSDLHRAPVRDGVLLRR